MKFISNEAYLLSDIVVVDGKILKWLPEESEIDKMLIDKMNNLENGEDLIVKSEFSLVLLDKIKKYDKIAYVENEEGGNLFITKNKNNDISDIVSKFDNIQIHVM